MLIDVSFLLICWHSAVGGSEALEGYRFLGRSFNILPFSISAGLAMSCGDCSSLRHCLSKFGCSALSNDDPLTVPLHLRLLLFLVIVFVHSLLFELPQKYTHVEECTN